PANDYATVQLRNLDGSGRLTGRWVRVESSTGTPAYSATNTFLFDGSADQFEQVMAYFWINQAQEYLQSLGFGSTLPPVNAQQQQGKGDPDGGSKHFPNGKPLRALSG